MAMSLFMTLGASACSEQENAIIPPTEEENNNGDTSGEENEGDTPTSDDILIVYFSRTGENYAVGTISVGNTTMMAGYIQEIVGGTLFEITPEVPYPDSYEATKLISQKERDENLRPAIKNKLNDLDKYSTVFIGSPIWYGGPPMIMQTFYEAYPELAGKTIIPFGTHEGSGTASLATVLKQYFPNALIKQTLGLTGREVRSSPTESRAAVKNWINRIGITQ